MSAEEIKALAEDCEKEARHLDEDAGVAFSCGDLRMKDVFDTLSKTERQKATALLSYAAMVERCEKIRADIMARTFRHDIGWMGGDDKTLYTTIGEILQTMKGATNERK